MSFYLFTLALVMFFSYLVDKKEIQKYKFFFLFLVILSLILISGFRVDTTLYSDEWNYRHAFNSYDGMPFKNLKLNLFNEPGFIFLNWILANVFHNSQSLILVTSIITNTLITLFIYRYTKHFTFSMFLYISSGSFFSSMNIIRQYLAIAIILSGFKYIEEKNLKKFLIIVFIAFLFHKSAIIMIFVYFYVNSLFIDKHKFIAFLLILLIMYNFSSILQVFENSMYNDYVTSYMESGYGVSAIRVLFWSIIYVFILWRQGFFIRQFKVKKIMFNSIFISFGIILISSLYVYVNRLDYLSICSYTLIPMIPYCFVKKSRLVIQYLIIFLFFAFGMYSVKDMTFFEHLIFTFL